MTTWRMAIQYEIHK